MNKFIFNQVGGFPLTTNILNELQKSYEVFNALGGIAGNLTILSGCEITGSTVSDGAVYIDGEVLPFVGGSVQTKVIVKEEITQLTFQDGNNKNVIKTRYATFGTGIVFFLWVDFIRPISTKSIQAALAGKAAASVIPGMIARLTLLEKKAAIFQAGGGMVFWNKPLNQIPDGWAEVEDWRGRIPVGLDITDEDFNELAKENGAKSKTLSVSELPEHDHTFEASTDNIGANGNIVRIDGNSTGQTATSSSVGAGQAFSIMNPYRVVIFIEYTE